MILFTKYQNISSSREYNISRYILFSIFCAIILLQNNLFPQNSAVPDAGKQIVTEDMIKSAGITSLSEILVLAEEWNVTTIDGAYNFFTANNLSSFQSQNVLIFLDGQRLDIEIFDVQNLNLLPVSIDQIDYVEFINVPEIYNGEFVQNGVIHFHTKKPEPGLSLQGTYITGDETGDPGPLAFTEFNTPNVDKLMQFFSVNVNSGGENWFMKGSVKHEEAYETDPAITRRISFLNYDDNKTSLISYSYKLNLNALNGVQNLLAGITTNNDYFFLRQYGNEIPTAREFRHFGINGNSDLSRLFSGDTRTGTFGINYSAKISVNNLGYLNNNHRLGFDFGLNNFLSGAEVFFKTGKLKAIFGFGYERFTAVTSRDLSDKNLIFKKLYGEIELYPTQKLTQSLGIFTVKNYGDIAIKGFLQNRWQISRKHYLFANFSFIQNLFPEDNNFLVWQERGYVFNSQPNDYSQISFNNRETFTADLIYRFVTDSSLSINIAANFRQFSNFYLEQQFYQYDSINAIFHSLTDISTNENLKTMGGSVGINYRINSRFSSGIFYNYNRVLEGSNLFIDEMKSIPEHSLMVNLNYQPFQNLGLSTRVRYYTLTKWYNYKFVSYQSGNEYIMEVKPGVLMDVSANLWLWKRKIWLNIISRNVLNRPEKYHPIGADFALRFYLQAHFYFNSLVE